MLHQYLLYMSLKLHFICCNRLLDSSPHIHTERHQRYNGGRNNIKVVLHLTGFSETHFEKDISLYNSFVEKKNVIQ